MDLVVEPSEGRYCETALEGSSSPEEAPSFAKSWGLWMRRRIVRLRVLTFDFGQTGSKME